MSTDTAMVVFEPLGRCGRVPKGISIVEASRLLGADLEAPCGETRRCGKCKVRVIDGGSDEYGISSRPSNAGPWQTSEEQHIGENARVQGVRLGCAARVEGDLLLFVPESSRTGKPVISKAPRPLDVPIDPAIRVYPVRLTPPALKAPVLGDLERLAQVLSDAHGLAALTIHHAVLQTLSKVLRENDWAVAVRVWMDREIVAVVPETAGAGCGMAFDVGTTTIAGYLCDLETGHVLSAVSMLNPQCRYGEDVMSRIAYAMTHPEGLLRMQQDVVSALNALADKAIGRCAPAVAASDIMDAAVCGNTAMHHILLGLDPRHLGMAPFTPTVQGAIDIPAGALGLHIHPAARVFVLPNEAGFVGADNAAVLLAERPDLQDAPVLIVDIGTNGEIVLGNRERLMSASCATGPALEGAQIHCGMRAVPGAIERVTIAPDTHEVDYKVIGRAAWRRYSEPGEMKALGICGSGVIDAVAHMVLAGVLDRTGAFAPSRHPSDRLRKNADTRLMEFVLAWPEETADRQAIVITQKDVRQVQMAKAALYAGCRLLMRKMGVERVSRIKIAGAFGTHIDRDLALVLGLVPDIDPGRIASIGNAAGDGCRIALLNRQARRDADRLARQVEYVELALEPDFQEELLNAISMP